ncbi:hypothetical protein [Catellatospora bangladeshensis]|uniref:hypothetical protein n=1 Tax=Catellatospora bangladeshensis TaxID=310355 RepID=UPI0019412608|nr:hypothetical protein [Catellatospora bangladeshensis]
MGVDVQLRRPLRHRQQLTANDIVVTVSDSRNVFVNLVMRVPADGNMPILSRIKPWSDAVVYDGEFELLLGELDALRRLAISEDELGIVGEIETAAERCVRDGGLELHFLGD